MIKKILYQIMRIVYYLLFPACGIIILVSVFNIPTIFDSLISFPKEYILAILFPFAILYISVFCYIFHLKDVIEKQDKELARDREYMKSIEKDLNRLIETLTTNKQINTSYRIDLFPYERGEFDKAQLKHFSEIISNLIHSVQWFSKCIEEKDALYRLIGQRSNNSISRITSLYSDFLTLQFDISEKYLKNKKHPAFTEAMRINELKKETRSYIEQFKIMQYKYEELLALFPELNDYVEDFDSIKELENAKNLNQFVEEYDKVRDYISKEDYLKLSESQRNQLALERYIKSDKSKWQIGRDYELYIGHLFRQKGWKVWNFGIEKKLEDLGCDIIVVKDNLVQIVQCKRWREDRQIHEKHIIHLYGTYILLKCNYKEILNLGLFNETVKAWFISTHKVTEKAQEIAKLLDIGLQTVEFSEFPRIKCNINNENKIYHLPFDQQYDTAKIENVGEFYAWTVKDAEKAGFRRAFKWHGN